MSKICDTGPLGYQQIPVTADLQDPSAREESVNSIKSLLQGLLNSITSHFVSNVKSLAFCDLDAFGESNGYSGILTSPRSARYRSEPFLVGECWGKEFIVANPACH